MTWWHRLWRRREMEEQLEKELRFHIEEHASELHVAGQTSTEARRQARLALGGPEQVKELCRDARGTRWLEDFLTDFRYALRGLWQKPGFAAVTLMTLALGTGATTAMFTVVNGVMLKPLPFVQPGKLVLLQEKTEKATQYGDLWAFAYPNYLDCKRESRSLELAAWRYNGGTVSRDEAAEYVNGVEASPELFSVLGINPVRGRVFSPEENHTGAAPVMMVSYELWQRLFAGSPSAIGSQLTFDQKSYSVIGVLPAGFRLNENDGVMDIFIPLGQDTSPSLQNRARHPGINVYARLQPGTVLAQVRTELGLIGENLAKQYPDSNAGRTFIANPLRPDVGNVGSTLWLLLGAVSLVLLIACANVANLLLARAVSREREFAMRVALGASRGRIVRQCLTESAVLGLAGGALGVLLAVAGVRQFVAFWPGGLPRVQEVHLDWRVLLFALGVSLLSGLLFGLAPALRIPARGLEQTLRAGARTVTGSSRRLHGSFVISEIALAVVLLVSAGILGRTLLRLSSLNPGLNVHNVLVSRMALSPGTVTNPARTRAAWQDVLDHARSVPGVQAAAIVDTVPLRDGYNEVGYSTTPAMPAPDKIPVALATSVTPDYLNVIGMPLLEGRFFDDHDRMGNQVVIVIDDVFARQVFGQEDPVGKRLWIASSASPFSSDSQVPDAVQIVGVVGHVRHWGPANDDQAKVRAQFYYPFAQVADPLVRRWSELMSIAVRTSGPALNVVQPLREAVRGTTGDQVLYEVRTMEQLASASLARQRFLLFLFGMFAGLALLLACIGIYGVLAYLTGQRVQEIGLRMALGASARNVMQMILRQSLTMIAAGVGVGIAGAWVAARLLENSVEGVRTIEPSTFVVMVLILAGAALFASFVPARRASRVDPMLALRQD